MGETFFVFYASYVLFTCCGCAQRNGVKRNALAWEGDWKKEVSSAEANAARQHSHKRTCKGGGMKVQSNFNGPDG